MHKKFNGEAEWHALREAHIGGSEVASLFNLWRLPDGREVVRHLFEAVGDDDVCLGSLSPYKTGYRLWAEKSGKVPPEDLQDVERIQAGQFLEPAIAAWANRRWPDWNLLKSRVYHVHPTIGGFGASLDYFVRKGNEPVDIKNVDGFVFREKWALDPETGEIVDFPLPIVLQIQHQIACTGAQRGHVLACVAGNELRRGSMERHQPTIDKIEVAVASFWQAVEQGIQPADADYSAVAEAYSVGQGKDEAPPVDYRGVETASRAFRRFCRWKRHADFVETQMELLKGRLGQHLGESYQALFDGGKVTWPTIHRPEKQVSYLVPAKTYRGGMRITQTKG